MSGKLWMFSDQLDWQKKRKPSTRLTERWFLSGVISLSRISENSTGKPEEDRDWRKRMKAADKEKAMAKMERRLASGMKPAAYAASEEKPISRKTGRGRTGNGKTQEKKTGNFQTFRLDEGGR